MLINLFFERGEACLVFGGDGGKKIVRDRYLPHFYAICDEPEEKRWLIEGHPLVVGAAVEGGAVKVTTTLADFRQVARDVRKVSGVKELAETAVPHYLRYMSGKGLRFFEDYDSGLARTGPEEDEIAGLGKLSLGVIEKRGKPLVIGEDGEETGLEDGVRRHDVLFSCGGDEFLKGENSVRAAAGGCLFRECIHLDVQADIGHDIYDASGENDLLALGKERLIRVMELSRMSGARPDLVPRITAGKLNVLLHMAAAKRMGLIIPDLKKQVERPKTLGLLLKMDKGGTIFYPTPGVYEGVAKCDFASMYPNIIVRHNISPETMHCGCGDDETVPEAGWSVCRKKGLIPRGLEAVLERRLALKRMMKAERDPEKRRVYDLRQRALKNILVTSFGYLGFKNFIFSNVECKECVVLYGRHIMERARAIALEEGLDVVYGMVDSVFVRGGSREDYERYVSRVSREAGFSLELDCVFARLAFPSGGDGSGVANKYYGITEEGGIEARGIAMRHSDSPLFVKKFQERAVRELLDGGFRPERLGALERESERALLDRKVPLEELAITKSVRKEAYKTRQAHAVALARSGIVSSSITFVHTVDGPVPLRMAGPDRIDPGPYRRLLRLAQDELVIGLYAARR